VLIDQKIRQVCDVIGPDLSELQKRALRVALAEYALDAIHSNEVRGEAEQILTEYKEEIR
jgi:hypothetical protein